MGKKVIRLNETDIENIVRKVIIEQGRGDLVGAKRKKNKNRRDESSSNWGGKDEGTLNFDIVQTEFQAVNVGPERFSIAMHNQVTKVGKEIPGEQTNVPGGEEITLDEFEIAGSSLPYADNMVKPYFDKYPDAQSVFDGIVTKFVNYINAGGGPKLTNVTIKGSADSARPTLDVPSGYSQLDHPDSKPYNGETDPFKMNQYLANKRAEEYANVLKSAIKEKSGFDLTIKVLPGDNFYGQEGKRGEEYRKIILSPNAEVLTVSTPTSTDPSTTTTPGEKVTFPSIPYYVAYYYNGKGVYVKGYKVVEGGGNKFMAISREQAESWGTPIFDGQMSSEIKGDKFYIDGKLVGTIQPKGTAPQQFSTMGREFSYWVGPITNIRAFRNAQIEGEGEVTTAYLDEAYFLFY